MKLKRATDLYLPKHLTWLGLTFDDADHGVRRAKRDIDAYLAEVVRWCHDQFGDAHGVNEPGTRWTLDYIDMFGFSDPADATATLMRWG